MSLRSPDPSGTTFILIMGAWHCASNWHAVKSALESRGHTVLTPDLPGHGSDRRPLCEQDLTTYTHSILSLLDSLPTPSILVGHSLGGAIACQAADQRPGKVHKLVVLSGFLLRNGQSASGLQDGAFPVNWQELGESGFISFSPDHKVSFLNPIALKERFYPSLSGEAFGPLVLQTCGASVASQTQAVVLGDGFAGVPKYYILSLQDEMLPAAVQREMVERVGVEKVYPLNAGHVSFHSAPKELAEILDDIAGSNKKSLLYERDIGSFAQS